MRQPCWARRAAQFMFASPRRAKQVRTFSCVNAWARTSYTRRLASIFIVSSPTGSGEELFHAVAARDHALAVNVVDRDFEVAAIGFEAEGAGVGLGFFCHCLFTAGKQIKNLLNNPRIQSFSNHNHVIDLEGARA